jgi:epoxyqueuosine reductase QueG
MPPDIYMLARNLGEPFLSDLHARMVRFFSELGFRAVGPAISGVYRVHWQEKPFSAYANWSERHAAFAAGLGTFSLHEGMITEAGCNVRFASLITDAPLPVTPRKDDDPYANCLHYAKGACGKCIAKCPAGAVTTAGHDKLACRKYYGGVVTEMALKSPLKAFLRPEQQVSGGKTIPTYHVGCALCQFGVPCTRRNPMA